MNDAFRVRVGERVGDLDGEIDDPARVHGAAGDQFLERVAGHVLEHQEQLALVLADLVERGDVRMRQRCSGARLLQEAGAAIRIVGDRRRQHFDRDGAAETRIAGAEDFAHAPGADALEDLVMAEGLEHGTPTIILTR